MKQSNGYITVEIKGNQAIGHIIPATAGGKPIRIGDAEEYLRAQGIANYNRALLKELIDRNEVNFLDLGPCDGIEFSESMKIKISLDKMKATCTFMPPSKNGPLMMVKDIMSSLSAKGVVVGIDQDAILDYMNERCYATEFVFALGKPPVIGHDGRVEYHFNVNHNLKPKHNEDGSVDYRSMDTITSVMEGDVLATLVDPYPGEAGYDVTGKEIPQRPVKPAIFHYGKDIRLSEDGKTLYSEITGHVTISQGKINVSKIYEVPVDVDNSIGNIDFDGDVHVKGNVRSGFSIFARGDITVEGVVEGAFLQADGNIIVKQGIHGMQKGILDARGQVVTSFIENAKVFSGGLVETGSILYSEVNAAEDVNVLDKKGFIVGGVIRAGGKVESMIIGSQMGTTTKIEVGMAPEKKERYAQMKRSIDAMVAKINKLSPIVKTYQEFLETGKQLDPKNADYLRKLVGELQQTKALLQDSRTEFNALHQELINTKHSKVIVHKEIFPGVEVVVSDLSIHTKKSRSMCKFEKRNGEIVVSTI